MDVHERRRRTDDELEAMRLLQELEPDGTADGTFRGFVQGCPPMRAKEYVKALRSSAVGKENRTSWIIHLIRSGKAMLVAKRRVERAQEPEERPWALPPAEGDKWSPELQDRFPHYEPTEGLLENLKRLQNAQR